MTRDFVSAAPVAFPHVVASEPERFVLQPSTAAGGSPCLFVLALEAETGFDID